MDKHSLRIIALAGFFLMTAAQPTLGQFDYRRSKEEMSSKHLLVDYAFFQGEEADRYRLEIYYQIHNRGLTFTAGGDHFTADYELAVTVRDDDDEMVKTFTKERRVVLAADEEARTRTDFRTSQINLDLEPGKYKIRFKLKDRTTDRLIHKKLEVKLKGLHGRQPRLSTVEFAQAFEDRTDSGSVFAKGDILVIPSVHRVYGSLKDDRVAFYYEIYPGTEVIDKVVVETKVRHYRKGMLYRDTLHVSLGDARERRLQQVSLDKFLPGEYELEIFVRGRRNKELAHRTQEFKVSWSQEGMVRNDWGSVIKQLVLFSEDVDVGDREDLNDFEERQDAFTQVWRERDPTEGTMENEAKMGFYHRVRIANERFGIMRREGWRSDRGKVFIRYGEPDHILEEPFSLDSPPYQVWNYSSISPHRRFVFIDENQDGDYRVQYPYDGLGYPGGY